MFGACLTGSIEINLEREFVKVPCCIIPTCVQEGSCYETLSCGQLCASGKFGKPR